MTPGKSGAKALQIAALAVAGGLAIWVSGPLAFKERPPRDGIGTLERALDPLRSEIGPQARVALFAPNDDIAPWYATQYALAPATVVRVKAAECLARGAGPSCGADATHLLVLTGNVEYAAAVGRRFGFVPALGSDSAVLLVRGPW